MNLAAVPGLPTTPETAVWYRAINPVFLPSALGTTHTLNIPSRFSPGRLAKTPFRILYLAENGMVALFEVAALFGSPRSPGAIVPNPMGTWTIINAQVSLTAVVDLTEVAAHHTLITTAQELTGDWQGYLLRSLLRSPATSVGRPRVVKAPTQKLGEAIYRKKIEGFRAISTKVPDSEVLVVFPDNLRAGSSISYQYDDKGIRKTMTITQTAETEIQS